MDFKVLAKPVKRLIRVVDNNSPSILTGLAVGGVVGTIFFAIKAAQKAQDILYQEAEFRFEDWEKQTGEHRSAYPIDPVFSIKETIELTWQCYIPTAGMGLTTIACIIFANKINLRRNAALASLYSIAETTLKEYQSKVVEQLGEKKEEKLRGQIAQDHVDREDFSASRIVETGKGAYLCFDEFSGRPFRSDIESIRQAANRFNKELIREGWLGVNHFYDELGLPPMELGDEFGWIAERDILEIKTSTTAMKDTSEPCLVINFTARPIHI